MTDAQDRDPLEKAETLAYALALFRGAPLEGFRYDSFAQGEAVRIDELRQFALEEWIDAQLALGRHARLVAKLEQLVSEESLRERLRGQQMLALYRSGRQAEALEAYHRARSTFREELGVEPGQALQRLQRRILEQDPELELPEAVPASSGRIPTPPTPMIGRARELAEARDLLLRRDVRLVTLTGPGGIGRPGSHSSSRVPRCPISRVGRSSHRSPPSPIRPSFCRRSPGRPASTSRRHHASSRRSPGSPRGRRSSSSTTSSI